MIPVRFPPTTSGAVRAGVIVNFDSIHFVDMVALAGFDFVLLDAEHGPLTPSSAYGMIRAANSHRLAVYVRTPGRDAHEIQRYLDLGAHGIQAQVDNAAQARQLCERVFYPPKGCRGLSLSTPAAAFGAGATAAAYLHDFNAKASVFVTVENRSALAEIEAIAATEHLTGVCIGTGDLALSLGVPGVRDAPEVVDAVSRIVNICRARGIEVLVPATDSASARMSLELGVTGLQFPASVLVIEKGKQLLRDMRS
ncbi:5-keto-4-deoxy-D-glucarate aldolase (plasmid) [Variovorax sp. SRS16]|uniref:HpcH/HpaI aldolase family protein n=1 Tax=Variovorax sp. SRS16 TaxID=282217 RepID=UPI001317E308|nr:aldolase/citrate lyase family protein [Variovorax sp. SRS16]VTU45392.1 5-keto-4-deoxy-D-glucarate aldolase [Variovorax sp. SRS16]